ncbi:hypothetical protein Cyast_1108 [Cyanobacterium stanieri PCC 7202]|uniref:Uncharacterized protein n=1 Tax=Cyanobacterium stanieri (strain ATCC 29140 / PCC 7202) TaxID=292563 RepID=K9YKT0_CYASC|nr:hypothetical protein Cyast_1108 [Cyanobacterium stanieri PCC 7202]
MTRLFKKFFDVFSSYRLKIDLDGTLIRFLFKNWGYVAIALITFSWVYFSHAEIVIGQKTINISWEAPAYAQRRTPETIAQEIYEQMPDIPKNNQYISSNTGEIASHHTLISRLIRYHEFVKSRPTIFRLDWKLTLADYLGYNEMIREGSYPGFNTLTQNPFNEDRELIKSLSREQRNQLVDTLVSIYQPPSSQSEEVINPSENENLTDNTNTPSIFLPSRGGADLLMP